MAFGQASVIALLVGILVQDLAIQGVHVTNSSALYRMRPEARSRLTAGHMTSYFIGGASGLLVSSRLYAHFAGPAYHGRAPSSGNNAALRHLVAKRAWASRNGPSPARA